MLATCSLGGVIRKRKKKKRKRKAKAMVEGETIKLGQTLSHEDRARTYTTTETLDDSDKTPQGQTRSRQTITQTDRADT